MSEKRQLSGNGNGAIPFLEFTQIAIGKSVHL